MTCAHISMLHYIMSVAPVAQDPMLALLVPVLMAPVPALLVPASSVQDPVLPELFPQPVQI